MTRPARRRGEIRLELDQRASYRFSLLSKQETRCLAAMYGPKYGLSISTWKVLSVIGHFAPISSSEAGKRTSLEPDKVTRAVDSLVEQGLVLRRQDPDDRRRVILSLSAKGRRTNDDIERVRHVLELEFLGILTPDEIETLYTVLDKLSDRAAEIFASRDAWRELVRRHAASGDGDGDARVPRRAPPSRARSL
jgi:DNA-binding MarR family transcriptional regulator